MNELLYNPFKDKRIDLKNPEKYRDFLKVSKNYLSDNKKTYKLEELELFKGIADVVVDDIAFKTLIIPSNTSKLFVSLTSGRRNTDVRFVRWKYSSRFDGSFLAIDDPMFKLYKNMPSDLMGWFYGTKDNNYLLKISLIIKKVASLLNVNPKDITLLGSSSGGYAAAYLGNLINECSVIALNPQLILSKWPFSKKLERITGLNFVDQDDRNYVQVSNTSTRYFFYYNLLSKNDIPQLEYLLSQFDMKIQDLKYGLNKIRDNVTIWINIIDFYNRHVTSPEVYEIMFINYLLEISKISEYSDEHHSLTVLVSEMMNQRFEALNKVHYLDEENMELVNSNNVLLKEISKIEAEHWTNGQFANVLNDFKTIFKFKNYNCKWSQFRHTRTSVTKVYPTAAEQISYWNSLSNVYMTDATSISHILKNQAVNLIEIQDKFNKFIDVYIKYKEIKNVLKECFRILSNAIYNKTTEEYQAIVPKHSNHIIVSSFFVASGSSALYDYLSEFSNIQLVPGEFSILESSGGFAGFARNINNSDYLIKHSVDFFFRNIVGCYIINKAQDFKEMYVTNHFIDENYDSLAFSEVITDIVKSLSNLIIKAKQVKDVKQSIHNLSTAILNFISVNVPSDKIPLIDNSIHVHNIDIVNYVDNIKLACVSRDPRASYTTRILYEAGYIEPPREFIKSYTKVINIISKKISMVDAYSLSNKIVPLNFEYLVSSEKARKYILDKLNIDYSNWVDKNTHFKPEESKKNIDLYVSYKDQNGISDIKNSLSDYCVDLTKICDDNVSEGEYSVERVGTNKLFPINS